ncbi:DUF3231 family protein [Salicibibacter halophilus]|uniref:DUF3231 family protein n=1 Tax=Salicibibacter halophilus TaxID=2502791 RepID=A0A514LIW5_9BACI|nr:DUF3231 family protein [Salicibibacter halophilus]QDI91786.1 DUF3231 family protein [Salicibibacter halophilus]
MDYHSPLTASEINMLWGFSIKNSLSVSMMTYFLAKVEDPDISEVLQLVKKQSETALDMIQDVCQREQMAIPIGFTDEDVNPSAPRLFSDAFMLEYTRQLEVITMATASAAIPTVTREDTTNICQTVLQLGMKNHDIANRTSGEKGIYKRPPIIPAPKEVDFVENQRFLAGFLRERRPLSVIEITQLFMNTQTNALGKALMMGFSQTAKDTKIKKFLVRGKEIAHKHMEIFSSHLLEEDLPVQMAWDDSVSDATTEAPFSDKLMTFQTTTLIDAGIGNYGLSLAGSPRRDLGMMYARLVAEIAMMAEDGGELLIEKGWLEQPPLAPDRDTLGKGQRRKR